MSDAPVLKQIKSTQAITDKYIKLLEGVEKELAGAISQYYKISSPTKIIDYVLAKNNIDAMLVEAGYYTITQEYADKALQEFVNSSYDVYEKMYGIDLTYTDKTLADLTALKQTIDNRFVDLGESIKSDLATELTRMQLGDVLQSNAIPALKKILGSDMARYVYTWVNTSGIDYSNAVNQMIALDNGISRFRYAGVLDTLTRPFCRKHLNEVHTKEEWSAIHNDSGGVAWTDRGGWNCRHQFIGVPNGE